MIRTTSFILGFFLVANPVHGAFNSSLPQYVDDLLSAWDIPEAEIVIQTFIENHPETDDAKYFQARLEFLKGRYEDAWTILKPLKPKHPFWIEFKSLVDQTRQVASEFVSIESDHFIFFFKDGPDEILVPYATEVLEQSYEKLGKLFNYFPQEKVRVEFYPSRKPFSRISPLTLQDILTSGTVALCKYNRIMAISPGSLVRGYNWMDTLSHEYVHYLLTKKSKNTAPLWLHEGLAKYFEARWRTQKDSLSPLMETVLANGLESNYFIGLNDMMPSLAKLKTAEDVQLAYAEVYSMVEYMILLKGEEVINELIETLAQGVEIEGAIFQIFGQRLNGFQEEWKRHARQKGYKTIPGIKILQFQFKDDRKDSQEDDSKDYDNLNSKQARDYTFLGDILKSRNYLSAAILEYEKAIQTTGTLSPIIYNKLASTLMLKGEPEKAEPLLQKSLQTYPMFTTTLTNLGQLYFQLEKLEIAADYFEQSVRMNPFNPFVHMRLIDIYKKLNRTQEKETQARLFQYLE